MNRNKKIILSLVLVIALVMGLGIGIKLNNKKYEDKKQSIIENRMEVAPDEEFNVEIIKDKKLVVIYDYVEDDFEYNYFYYAYSNISKNYSNMYHQFNNDKNINIAHVYLEKDLTIHFISVNGVNVYENGDLKEGNEYYESIYNTIFEKALGGKIKEL